MTRLLLGIILLTSCSSYHKATLTFIAPKTINFQKPEDSQTDKIRYSDTLLIYKSDTIKVLDGYSVMSLQRPDNIGDDDPLSTYLFLTNNKELIDYVHLTYYKKELYCIRIFTKDIFRVDSLSNQIEKFYKRTFKETKSEIRRDRISIYKAATTVNSETQFIITNNRVHPPPFCNSTKWYDYLAFWHRF